MLFGKELKKALFSIPCLLLLAVTFLFYCTQLGDSLDAFKRITPPPPGQESYGIMPSDDPALIMPVALSDLYGNFVFNSYSTYPWGFIRHVKLGSEDVEKMAGILGELSGNTTEEMLARVGTDAYRDGEITMVMGENGELTHSVPQPSEENSVSPAGGLTYERFAELMGEADSLLGGGSSYAPERLSGFGKRDKTYEEALAEYEASKEIDRFTGAHARLFADYMTIFAAWLPAFLMVSECLRDRRAKAREIIWARKISSLKLTACRYFPVVLLSMAPVLVLAGIDTVRAAGLYAGETIDLLAYFKYALGWILPTVLFSAAAGMFFTELTDTPIGLLLILAAWVIDLNRGMLQMDGGYGGFLLIPRHNSLIGAQTFAGNFSALLANRLFYTALALALAAASALILEQKRKGAFTSYDTLKARLRRGKGMPAA